MSYPYGTTVYRDRRPTIDDPYNPGRPTVGDWASFEIDLDPETGNSIELDGCYVADSSATAVTDPVRGEALIFKSLYCDDPDVDVKIGDRIRSGDFAYYVNVRPEGDTNPFTGWTPGVEIPLSGVSG